MVVVAQRLWNSMLVMAFAVVLGVTLPPPSIAQDNRQLQRDSSRPANERRTALVIGNGAYTNAPPLKNPPNDARDMAATLKVLGFDVTSGVNVNQRDMKRLIREFGQKLQGGGSGLFYFAGHGMQSKGKNYLIPIEADIQSEIEVEDAGVDVNLVLGYMEDAQNGLNIVILDACRNNPFARGFRSASNGLAQVDAPTGTLVAYATAPGRVASDGTGQNGLYTSELLKQMKVPGVSVTDMFMRVRAEVMKQTANKQVPWESSSLVGAFYFSAAPKDSAGTFPTPVQNETKIDALAVEREHWENIRNSTNPQDFRDYLSNYPTGAYSAIAKTKLRQLETQTSKQTDANDANKPPADSSRKGGFGSVPSSSPRPRREGGFGSIPARNPGRNPATDSPRLVDKTSVLQTSVKDFLFAVDSCERVGDRVACEATITSNASSDQEIVMSVAGGDDSDSLGKMTRAFDRTGAEHIPRDIQLGSVKQNFGGDFGVCCPESETVHPASRCAYGGCRLKNTLMPGVPMKIRIVFVGFRPSSSVISILRIYFISYGGEKLSADFRDLPIVTTDKSNPQTASGNALSLLRFDGVYCTTCEPSGEYLRLYSDGTFVGVGRADFRIDEKSFSREQSRDKSGPWKGVFQVDGSEITFTYPSINPPVTQRATILQDGLHFTYGASMTLRFATWRHLKALQQRE